MTKKQIIFYSILSLILLGVLGTGIFAVGIYRLNWNNRVTAAFLGVVPLPVAAVDNQFITYPEYLDQVKIYEALVKTTAPEAAHETAASEQKQQILQNLIENKMVASLASKRKLSVSSQEIDTYFEYLIKEFRLPEDQVDKEIQTMLGIDIGDFKQRLVVSDLVRSKLAISLLEEQTENLPYQQTKAARERVTSGEDFRVVASQMSDDAASTVIGGDMGFLVPSDLPPWFGKVFQLKKGELSEVFASPEGYHIFEAGTTDPETKAVQLRQIFKRASIFEQYLDKQKPNFRVYIFGKK